MNTNVFIPLDRGVIRVTGPDAAGFLQDLITNDVALLDRQESLYACLLTPQGKFLHDFFVIKQPDGYLLECEPGPRRDDLLTRLTQYKLRRDIALTLLKEPRVFSLFSNYLVTFNEVFYKDPRHPDMGSRLITEKPDDTIRNLVHQGFTQADFVHWDERRINLEIPDGSRDAEVGQSTLEELNIPRLHGVSFTKGCYIGQELTAKMHNRNLGKRRLRKVTGTAASPLPPYGSTVQDDKGQKGTLRSTCGHLGLALIREEAAPGDQP